MPFLECVSVDHTSIFTAGIHVSLFVNNNLLFYAIVFPKKKRVKFVLSITTASNLAIPLVQGGHCTHFTPCAFMLL